MASPAELAPYRQASRYIDWDQPALFDTAKQLAQGRHQLVDIARACFEFVRDEIQHSWDYARDPVTCKASEVLKHGTGFCYAKSHLLAALLRANGVAAGLCYQRLTITGDRPPFCLHGLNALWLPEHGWYRVDARGNKPGVAAAFCPPKERLAFPILSDGEADLPGIYAQPWPQVVRVLESAESYRQVADNLPDSRCDGEIGAAPS